MRILTFVFCLIFFPAFSGGLSNQQQKDYSSSLLQSLMGFEENKGQVAYSNNKPADEVLFRANGQNVQLYITRTGLVFNILKRVSKNTDLSRVNHFEQGRKVEPETISCSRVDMTLLNAKIKTENIQVEEPVGSSFKNYYYEHCPDGVHGVKTYKKITIYNVYPGIDWVFYADEINGVKYDFIVHPGADASQIKMFYEGAELETNALKNALTLKNPLEQLSEGGLFCYTASSKNSVSAAYSIHKNVVSINLGKYDRSQKLVIDPPMGLLWATAYGGGWLENPTRIAIDSRGYIYIVGESGAQNFLAVKEQTNSYTQANTINIAYYGDACIVKFDNWGRLKWSTSYGGGNLEKASDISIDSQDNVFVVGITQEDFTGTFPLPAQSTVGGAYYDNALTAAFYYANDSFILKFDQQGKRLWGTLFGGSYDENATACAHDKNDNFYLISNTNAIPSSGVPLLNGGLAFYSGTPIGIDPAGYVYDILISKFDNQGVLKHSTYWGGDSIDWVRDVIFDANDNMLVCGVTTSKNLPVLNAIQASYKGSSGLENCVGGAYIFSGDGFVAKFNNNLSLQFCTYYGGTNNDNFRGIIPDAAGNIYVSGSTMSADFPVSQTKPYMDKTYNGPNNDCSPGDMFLLKLSSSGSFKWCQFIGGSSYDGFDLDHLSYGGSVAIDKAQNVFIVGGSQSNNYPTVNGGANYYQQASIASNWVNGVITKFDSTGLMTWSTYVGSVATNSLFDVLTDKNGCVFATGRTNGNYGDGLFADPGDSAFVSYGVPTTGGQNLYVVKFCGKDVLTISVDEKNVSCTASNDGKATALVNGGQRPYSYMWSTLPVQTDSVATGLTPGTYTVLVTDLYGVTSTQIAYVKNSNDIQINPTVTNATCNKTDGKVSVAVSGGAGTPYTYSWSTNPVKTVANIGLLAPGDYTLTVTDKNGCKQDTVVTIGGGGVTVTTSVIPSGCNGANTGQATASVPNGVTATYSWSNGETTSTITGLAPGNYTVTVSSNTSTCNSIKSVTVTGSPKIALSFTIQAPACGSSNGVLSVSPSGSQIYTYSWSNGSTAATLSNLNAGVYVLTATDQNGCERDTSLVLTAAGNLSVTTTTNAVSCFGGSNGSATASVSAANNISYSWSNGSTTSQISNLSAGTYTVVVEDTLALCSSTEVITISEPIQMAITTGSTTASCNASDGSAYVSSVIGGFSAYSYSWSNGLTNDTITNIAAGTYSVTVTDQNLCTVTDVVTISSASGLSLSAISTSVACYGDSNGTASAVASGPSAVTYSWNTGDTTVTITAMPAGIYTVTIIDNNGCTISQSIEVGSPPEIASDIVAQPSSIELGGTTTLSVTGGATYSWSPSSTLSCNNCSSPIATPDVTTWYTVIVSDTNGCTSIDSIMIEVFEKCKDFYIPNAFSPNNDGVNDLFRVRSRCIRNLEVKIFDRWGQLVFYSTDVNWSWDGTFHGQALDAGVFVYYIDIETRDDEKILKKGNVSLVR